jgi:2-dehydropantoate 2-reductase
MRAAILGAGSIGTVIGAFISHAGKQIDLVDTNEEHVRALNEHGATVTGSVNLNVPVTALTPDQLQGSYDLVFLLTKQTSTERTLEGLLRHLHPTSTICTLQNGIPEDVVEGIVGPGRTIGGAVGFGATWVRDATSSLTSSYESLKAFAFEIGEIDGQDRPRLHKVKEYLECVGTTKISSDLLGIRYAKLLMNATFSGMSAALGCTFGEILDHPRAMTCLAFIADECIKVAHAQQIRLVPMQGEDLEFFELESSTDIPSKMTLYNKIWRQHALLKASMLQDLEKNRETEIEYINGLVCRKGREHHVPTPFNARVVKLITEAQRTRRVTSFENIGAFDDLLAAHVHEAPAHEPEGNAR